MLIQMHYNQVGNEEGGQEVYKKYNLFQCGPSTSVNIYRVQQVDSCIQIMRYYRVFVL
jgi:hypothetical protein